MSPVRTLVAVALAGLLGATGCPSTAHPRGPTKLAPKDIVVRAKPAIVRIEDGEGRVGTGFTIDASGVIATNLHVVAGARRIQVTTLDGAVLAATGVRALDADHDLALVVVEPVQPLPTVPLGDSDKVAAGDPVVAIGNPLGVLDYTVSDGLISSVRQIAPDVTLLQISAPISQGSSGGPLFNAFGEVIGVATLVSNEGQNLNFAVPSNYVRALLGHPRPMTMAEFTALTRPPERDDPSGVKIVRQIPDHPLSVFDGCADADIATAIEAISEAIELGAPLYNQGNHEACFRIYEGTSTKLERDSSCKGIRDAFGAGLLRVSTLGSFTEKAWALRDTFDGVLDVARRYARGRGAGQP